MNLIIRSLRAHECESLAEQFSAFDETFAYFEARYLDQLLDKRRVFITWEAEQALGCASLIWESPLDAFWRQRIPEIADLWVQESQRHRGIGRTLIATCENEARQRGYIRIGITTDATDPAFAAARHLYPQLGYTSLPLASGSSEQLFVKQLKP